MHLAIQERQLFWPERELDGLCLARIKGNAPETAKFLDRASNRTHFVANIELNDFRATYFACVRYVYRNGRRALRPNRIGTEMQVVVLEAGVTQTPAEGEEWRN